MSHSCARWGVAGFLLTLAWAAYAQDPGAVVADPMTSLVVELVRNGGLPAAVFAFLYSTLGRGKGLTLTVALPDEAMRLLERLARAIEEMKRKEG